MRTVVRGAALAVGCVVLAVGPGAVSAQAGEIQGNGTRNVPIHQHPGNSLCAYSGQNDEYHEVSEDEPRVQSWGQDVKVNGPMGGVPGTACNPTRAGG